MIHFAIDRERRVAIISCQTDKEICHINEEVIKMVEKNNLIIRRTTFKEE